MAKPCRYQLPGEDKWMSESEFKKALNDGLIDKYIGEGTIAIRNFKPRAQAAPVVEAPVAETKTESSVQTEKTEEQIANDISLNTERRIREISNESDEEFPILKYDGNNEKVKAEVDYHNNKTSRVNKDGSWSNLYANKIIQKLIFSVGNKSTRTISTALRNAGFFIPASNDLGSSTKLSGGLSLYLTDSSEFIADDYSSLDDKVKATEILTKLANKLGIEVATLETEAKRPVEVIKTETPKAETKTEAPVAEVKEVKIPKNKKERQEAALSGEMVYHDLFGSTIESTPEQYEAALKEIAETGAIEDVYKYGKKVPAKQSPTSDLSSNSLLNMDKESAQFELDQRTQKTAPVAQPKAEPTLSKKDQEGNKFTISNKKTDKYSVPILLDPSAKVRGDSQQYISRELFDIAYANDNKEGAEFQTAETLIRRGGYTLGELRQLLKPELDKINSQAEPTQAKEPETEYQKEEPTEQPKTREDYIAIAKESNGDYAVVEGRTGYQFVFKKNRRTGRWQGLTGSGEFVDANDEMNRKANDAVNYTRKDRKIVRMKTVKNGITSTDEFVYDYNTNEWKKRSEDGYLYGIGPELAAKAEQEFLKENPKRAAKREKVEKFFDDLKAGIDENIIMSTLPFLTPKNRKRLIDAAKALVLAGMDLTTAINQAAHSVLNALVREKEITQQEADEALIEVYKGDFLLRPELSGIKNELASENAQEVARKGIDKMNVKEALDAGARAIQDGEVNPESLIETFVQGVGRVLTPIETAAMIRYKAGLDNEISDQYVKLASIDDKNSNEAKQVKTEIERLEKKVENYEIMQVTTGYYQSLSFSLRQFMLTSEYNITKLKAEIAAGYDGKIPEDILAKINEANAKLTQLNKDIARLEREKAKLEDSETIESIKNEKTKSSSGKAITSSNGRISISTDKIKEAISKGADTIEDVIEYVREDVKKQYPDATDREIRDAITNYGKVSSNTKSDLQKKIEEIRSIGKKISALEDIQAEKKRRESSKATGFFAKQRAKNRLRILSDREQELKRQIKEEMSKMPLTDEEIALKEDKRLEAFKKRTEARIKELKQRIADGDFSTKPRPKSLELDEEAKKLNAEREKILFQFEEEKAKAKYRQRSGPQIAFDALMSVLTLSKSLIASLDFSAPFRQGFVYTMSQDPRKTKKQMQEMFKLMNEENYTNWLADLKASDEYNLIKASKLFVAEPSAELSAREESFMSNLGQYVPVLGKSIKTKSGKEVRVGFDLYGKSERAYSGFLNVLRVQAFMEGATTLKEQGYTMEKNPEVFKAMADFVNNSTGRGTGGRAFENSAAALSSVFFSPRLIKSRLNLFNPVYYYKMPPSVRAIALKRMSKLMATSTMMVSLLAIAAAGSGGDDEDDLKIELDPRSSDFAKIRMGDTRIDILGGFQPYFRTFVQAIKGEKKDIETGEIKKLNTDFGGATRMSVISNLFTNKFSPISRTFYEYLSKYDYQKEADAAKEGKYSAYTDLAVPIYLQGIGDLYDEQGLNILWLTPLSVFGFDVQKYDKNTGKSNAYQNDFEFEDLEDFKDFDSEFETSDPFKN